MPRKPADRRKPLECREACWPRIREWRTFTLRDLWQDVKLAKSTIQDYLQGLARAGYLSVEAIPSGTSTPTNRYTLVKDPGPEPPRVRRDGTEVNQGSGRLQMWKAMRVLRTFTIADLVVHAATEKHQVATSEARTYCNYLVQAGYLTRRGDLYLFNRDRYTGPRPPMIQRVKQIYDPNLKKVVWTQGEKGGADE